MYDMVWYDMVWYEIVWYGTIRYGMIRYDMTWYDTILFDIICMMQYDTIRYDKVLRYQYDIISNAMIWKDIYMNVNIFMVLHHILQPRYCFKVGDELRNWSFFLVNTHGNILHVARPGARLWFSQVAAWEGRIWGHVNHWWSWNISHVATLCHLHFCSLGKPNNDPTTSM